MGVSLEALGGREDFDSSDRRFEVHEVPAGSSINTLRIQMRVSEANLS